MRAAFSTKILPRSKRFLTGTALIGASKRPLRRALSLQIARRSDVAAAPFEFLADHAEERHVRHRRQLQRLFRFPDLNGGVLRDPDRLTSVHSQLNRVIWLARFHFDRRIL